MSDLELPSVDLIFNLLALPCGHGMWRWQAAHADDRVTDLLLTCLVCSSRVVVPIDRVRPSFRVVGS